MLCINREGKRAMHSPLPKIPYGALGLRGQHCHSITIVRLASRERQASDSQMGICFPGLATQVRSLEGREQWPWAWNFWTLQGSQVSLFLRGVSEILWKSSISGRKQVPERGAQSWYIFCSVGQKYICDFAGHSAITATKCPLLLQPGLYSAPAGYVYKKCTLSWCREEPLQAAGHHWVLSQ